MLDTFLITTAIPANTEKGVYSPLLVLASYVIASFGSYTGLTLASSISTAKDRTTRDLMHASGAFALGSGIWAMHFLGMLAFKMNMAVSYDPLLTFVSMVIAVVIAYGVLFIAREERLRAWKIVIGAVLLGIGICAMHYTGMAAMEMDAELRYQPGLFFLSVAIAITASGAALWIVFSLGRYTRKTLYIWRVIAALVMGAAVCGMHYTGMAAAVFLPFADARHNPDQNFDLLALAIVVVTSVILGISLVFSLTDTGRRKAKESPFPIKLLALSSALTLFAVLWTNGNGVYFDKRITEVVQQDLEISNTGNRISYLDTLAARALKTYVITGDPKWGRLYDDTVRASNTAFVRLKDLTHQKTINNEAKGIEFYNRAQALDKNTDFFLQASEAKAIDLVHAGQLEKARALVDNERYVSRKQDYSDNLHKLADDANGVLADTLSTLAHTTSFSLYPGIVALTLLPIAWYFSFLSIRRWRTELEDARRSIEASQTEAMMAREKAEKANAIKSEFLANMSHELRTPLNSILGMLRLLKEARLDEEENSLAETAFRSSSNLLVIVNDILDLSKIEAGEMKLERIGMDLTYALDSVALTLDHIANEKHIALIRHPESKQLPYVLGDPTRFVRVLTNLIGNAIKYTNEGHVEIRASFQEIDDQHIEFRCDITDTGIGIPTDKLQTIFQKFSQADTSTTRKYGGTGLGLAITKQLLELMGGTVGVESQVDVGSTFWFTIPFEVTDTLNEDKQIRRRKMLAGTIAPDRARILVAEDHPMNQMLMTKLLTRFGIGAFEIVENGVEALKRYGEKPWDVILMDCHMPEKNGYDTTEEIRRIEKATGAHVPIVAMTANAMIGDKEKCLRCGMDEYISKPINIDELKEVLGQWIAFQDLAEPRQEDPPKADNTPALDLSVLRTFSEGDIEFEKTLIRAFVDQTDQNLTTLAENRTNTGSKAWSETAHRVKGGALGIGANVLAGLCNEAQHFTGSAAGQAALFDKINGEYARVKDHLTATGLLT